MTDVIKKVGRFYCDKCWLRLASPRPARRAKIYDSPCHICGKVPIMGTRYCADARRATLRPE